MTKLVHKLSALAVILAFFLQPTVVAAQFLPEDDFDYESAAFGTEFTGEQLRELNQEFGGFGNNNMGNGLLGQALGDQVACQAERPRGEQVGGGAIGQGMAQGLTRAAQEAIAQGLGAELVESVQADLTQRVRNEMETNFGSELEDRLRQEFGGDLNNINTSDSRVQEIIKETLSDVLGNSLRGSLTDSLPGAIGRSLDSGLREALPGQLGGAFEGILDGPFQNLLRGNLGGEEVGSDLLDQITSNLTNQLTGLVVGQLEGSLDGIIEQLTDGIMGGIEGSLDEVLGGMNSAIDEVVGGLTGSIDDIVGGLAGSLDDITSELTGSLSDLTDGLARSITEPIDELVGGITDSFGGMTDEIFSSIAAPISQLSEQLGGQISDLVGNVTEPLTNLLGSAGGGLVDNVMGGLTGGLLGGGGGILGGVISSSVPVHETGDLLNVTKDIKDIEEESRDVLIEICGHIKDIRRVQLAFEQKEFEGDAKARQEAADLVEEYRNQYLEFVKEGYVVDGSGEKDTLVVENYGDYYAERRAAAAKIVLDEYLKNSGDIFKEATREALTRQENESRYYPASTISREEYDKLKNPANMTSEELTTLLTKVYDPTKPNNPWTSYLINKDFLQQAKDRAEELAKDELQSSGFKPVRECVEVAEDGETCLKTRIITPGSIVENNVGKVFDSRVDQLEQADEVSDVGEETPAPAAEESERFETVDSQAGNSSNFDGGFARNIFSNLLSRLRGLFGNLGNNGGSGGGGGNNDDNNNNNNGTSEGPEISFTFTTAEVEDILAGEANQAFLNWQSEEAINCTAGNDWLSAHNLNRRVTILANQGRNVGTEGTATLRYPLTFNLRLERERGGQTTIIPMATTTNPSLTQQVVAIALENADVAAGDTFRLIVRAGGGAEQYVTTTASGNNAGAVVTALKNTVDNLSASSAANQEFDRLRLTVGSNGSGTGFITATIDPVYQITCRNNTGITTESVTITR